MLAQDGLLRVASEPDTTSRSGRFEVLQRFPLRDPLSDYPRLLHEFDPVCGELRTLRRCAGELAPVLSGTMNPLQLLFPGGSLTEARELYVESPFARTYNGALADTLAMAIAGLPNDRRLRVLEIGAGTGGTTGYVLPVLQAGSVEYTFTDLSPLFLEQAARRFEGHPCLRTALLDIERDPLEQGFEPSGFDVVIAANVLHATADVGAALRHVRQLMAPGGLLFLLEGVQPARWVDLTFGMTEGWWRFSDHQRRPDHPLVSAAAWADALSAQGFDDVVTVPGAAPASESRSQQALIVARAARLPRSWRVVGDVHGVGAALARRLAAGGDQVSLGSVDDDPGQLEAGTQLVYLGALELDVCDSQDPATIDACVRLAAERPLAWLSSAAGSGNGTRAWLATRAAQAAHRSPSPGGRWQAPLWGLGRVFALEHPARWGGLVDLSAKGSADEQAGCLLASLDAEDGEDQTAWRDGRRLAARLTSASVARSVLGPLRPDATYLVTGGFGGLGLIVGRWLAEMGARHVALMGRHPLLDSDGVRAIEERGAQVHALAADVADDQSVYASLRDLAGRAPPVRGVVHAAAALSAAPIRELSVAQVGEMMGPKIRGTIALERALRDAPLDFVTLFSSSTALLGASGLAHYAAANAFLDATASLQNRPGRRVLSVDWGTWESMRVASHEDRRSFVEAGLQPMPAADALAELGSLLSEAEPAQAMVAKVDWRVLKPLHEARRARPFLARLKAPEADGGWTEPDRAAAQSAAPSDLVARLERAPGSMRRDMLVAFVRGEVAGVLALKGDQDVPLETGLFDQGMDSLMSVELKRRLERGVGRPLPSTLTFNYPNVAAIAGFLERELAPAFPVAGSASAPGDLGAWARSIDGPSVSPAGALDSLSEDELEARLLASLERAR